MATEPLYKTSEGIIRLQENSQEIGESAPRTIQCTLRNNVPTDVLTQEGKEQRIV